MFVDEDFRLTDQTVQRMIDLLRDGISVDFIAQGLKFHHVHPSLVHYVKGPRLRSVNNLASEPAWLRIITRIERLEIVVAEHRAGVVGQLATYADVMVHLFPAAQTRLLQPTWTTIYSHVAGVILARHDLGSDRNTVSPGDEPIGLTGSQEGQLLELRQEIRQTVVRLARQREITWQGRPGSVQADRLSFQQLAYDQPGKNNRLKTMQKEPNYVQETETSLPPSITGGEHPAP
jgi:hypothetical protein